MCQASLLTPEFFETLGQINDKKDAKKFSEKPFNPFKMPPTAFSNAMNEIYNGWDFTGWESSKEWKLFNAGKVDAAQSLKFDADRVMEEALKVKRS